ENDSTTSTYVPHSPICLSRGVGRMACALCQVDGPSEKPVVRTRVPEPNGDLRGTAQPTRAPPVSADPSPPRQSLMEAGVDGGDAAVDDQGGSGDPGGVPGGEKRHSGRDVLRLADPAQRVQTAHGLQVG